ncbi:hypothetical protein EAW55_01745 [Legionella jordanis]|uniref:Uncharacterized protein n=2 Tax=Legionella jordanis TaxID=456 RepID=A0A0W0VG30_9GAMM|nr:hypothetical protein Ljor_0265 [Legionella jordanis]RMX05402.1 hypothetical protein EAW55_01745 [Legionella jordanis]RMX19084.1 hypothetical protein EAS68_06495 [Legionella jordanis]VEH13145.1 Uncharacterised protein [Legionella jordanis]
MIETNPHTYELKKWLIESCSDEPPKNRTFEIDGKKVEFDPVRAAFIIAGTNKVYFQKEVIQALHDEQNLNNLVHDMLA